MQHSLASRRQQMALLLLVLGCEPARQAATPETREASGRQARDVRAPAPSPPPSPPGADEMRIGEARLQVSLDAAAYATPALLGAWIERSARTVAAFYGGFPVPRVDIVVGAFPGSGVRHARVVLRDHPTIFLQVGRDTTQAQLRDDWRLVHEMVHLAFPSVDRQHLWMEEGLATYVEPLARARYGELPEADVWRQWLENMHQGLPEPGDRGLDHTPTWGRTYWGGALFCLLADIQIRKRTQGRKQLADALRGILRAGGRMDRRWPLERALSAGDAATGVPVLRELHAAMKAAPVPVDLEALWRELGVSADANGIRYDDGAPLGALRRGFLRAVGGGPDAPPTPP
jgi:hypothetical protein